MRAGLGLLVALVLACTAPAAAQDGAGETGRASGLPVPRFVSLGADQVNLRAGPGKQYKILWVLQRRGAPVEITAEFDTWRKVRTHEGDEGWVHGSLLSSRRTLLVTGGVRDLRRGPAADARVVAQLEPGVIAQLHDCRAAWCRVEVAGERGWLARDAAFGLLPDEQVVN